MTFLNIFQHQISDQLVLNNNILLNHAATKNILREHTHQISSELIKNSAAQV